MDKIKYLIEHSIDGTRLKFKRNQFIIVAVICLLLPLLGAIVVTSEEFVGEPALIISLLFLPSLVCIVPIIIFAKKYSDLFKDLDKYVFVCGKYNEMHHNLRASYMDVTFTLKGQEYHLNTRRVFTRGFVAGVQCKEFIHKDGKFAYNPETKSLVCLF